VHEPTREAIEGPAQAVPEPATSVEPTVEPSVETIEAPARVDEQLDLPYDQEADQ
jgi:hypothetical protein